MKKMQLIMSIRVEVDSNLNGLPETLQELERQRDIWIGCTANGTVLKMEILKTEAFNPNT